jgi:hypothetical protein
MIRDAKQMIVWFDTTTDADAWWERLVTFGIDARRASARVVIWFLGE